MKTIRRDYPRVCIHIDCIRKYYCKGMCRKHYIQSIKKEVTPREGIHTPRKAIIEWNIAKIPLGLWARDGYAIVDKNFAYLDYRNWSLSRGYVVGGWEFLHHMIIGKPIRPIVTDHINRNRLDNRECNLRHCTIAENNMNRWMQKNNKSWYIGVFWKHQVKRWVVHYKRQYIGMYIDKSTAIEKRKEVEVLYWNT